MVQQQQSAPAVQGDSPAPNERLVLLAIYFCAPVLLTVLAIGAVVALWLCREALLALGVGGLWAATTWKQVFG